MINSDIGNAPYSADLMSDRNVPAFLRWDSETLNTPYTDGLTTATSGFAFAYGQYSGWQTVVAFITGLEMAFVHVTGNGKPSGWTAFISCNSRLIGEQFIKFDQIAIEKDTDGLYRLHFYENGSWVGQIKSANIT